MDRQYIQDHQVIERYLRGKLTAEEEQAFEEAYLADADLLDELQAVERLGQGVKDLGARGEIKRASAARKWLSALASPQYAAAASVLLAMTLVLSGVLYVENLELRRGQGLATATATDVVPLFATRGDNAVEIDAPGENELKVLWIEASFDAYDSYRVVVARRAEQGLEEIARVEGLVPGFQDQLAVAVPGRLLTPGDYEVEVEGRMRDWPEERAAEPISRIDMRVVARESR
jgi:hypothetical protein